MSEHDSRDGYSSARELLRDADRRTVQQVGGDSKGITLDPDLVELGDQIFIEDTDEENVKRLVLPPGDE